MKKILIIIGLITILLMPIFSLSCTANIPASLGQQFTLPVNRTAEITGESLLIRFVAVTSDSRCPTGVVCIWSGQARCQLEITYQYATETLEVTISSNMGLVMVYHQYTIRATLEPYPQAHQQIKSDEYLLKMTITLE
jgi:hypothetical protein